MAKLFEADDYIVSTVLLLFLTINFNLQIGTIYAFMAIIDWISYYIALDTKAFKVLPIEKDSSQRFQNLVWAMGAYVLFIFAVNFVTTRFSAAPPPADLSAFAYVSSLVAATFSATPILAGSTYLKLGVWGLLIAFMESRFFFRTLYQWAINSTGGMTEPKNIRTMKALGVVVFFGAVFSIFHLVAKGITNNSSLLVTFMFGALSVGMVIHFQEAVQAIFLHVITNTIATMQQLGIGFFDASAGVGINSSGLIIMSGMLLATWLLIFHEIPFLGNSSRKAIGA